MCKFTKIGSKIIQNKAIQKNLPKYQKTTSQKITQLSKKQK
jgi:hypothetical protein